MAKREKHPYTALQTSFCEYLQTECGMRPATASSNASVAFFLARYVPGLDLPALLLREDFERAAYALIVETVDKVTRTGNKDAKIKWNMSCLRDLAMFYRLRRYSHVRGSAEPQQAADAPRPAGVFSVRRPQGGIIPRPCADELRRYVTQWDNDPTRSEPDRVLRQLFVETAPNNENLDDIILKVAAISTICRANIVHVYRVAEHIRRLGIDRRLAEHDSTLVNDLRRIADEDGELPDKYAFASRYCALHGDRAFPVYDNKIAAVLKYYRDREGFAKFYDKDLKDYTSFLKIRGFFCWHFGLSGFTNWEQDRYLILFSQEYFK